MSFIYYVFSVAIDVMNTAMHRSIAVAHGTAAKRKKIIEGRLRIRSN
jgi:mannitol/fructose-specific phosphotransferase system IIA component